MKTTYGECKIVLHAGEFSIERRTIGFAYPKSGNAHNPTPRFFWALLRDGKQVGGFSNLKAAKVLLADFQAEAIR